MNDELIIVNHIGTSVVEVIENELELLVNDIKKATKQKTVLAFSSQRAIDKLEKKGIRIEHIHDVILSAMGNYRTIKVLPTHLVGGGDYQRVKAFCERAASQLDIGCVSSSIMLVESLLTDENKVQSLADIIQGLIKEKSIHVLFIGHGTLHQSAIYYERFMKEYRELNNQVSFMTLDNSVEQMVLDVPEEIVVFPLFTVNGHHIRKDIFEGDYSICQQLLKRGKVIHEYRNGLLFYENIRKLYVESVLKV